MPRGAPQLGKIYCCRDGDGPLGRVRLPRGAAAEVAAAAAAAEAEVACYPAVDDDPDAWAKVEWDDEDARAVAERAVAAARAYEGQRRKHGDGGGARARQVRLRLELCFGPRAASEGGPIDDGGGTRGQRPRLTGPVKSDAPAVGEPPPSPAAGQCALGERAPPGRAGPLVGHDGASSAARAGLVAVFVTDVRAL